MKSGFSKVQKKFQKRRLPANIKISLNSPQNNFLNFDFMKTCFTIFRGYPWNIFETEICGTFFQYSEKSALQLLEFAKRSTFHIVKLYTFNTKTTFRARIFLKKISFKMFPKCYLDVQNIATMKEHSANIPGYCVPAGWCGLIFYLKYCKHPRSIHFHRHHDLHWEGYSKQNIKLNIFL